MLVFKDDRPRGIPVVDNRVLDIDEHDLGILAEVDSRALGPGIGQRCEQPDRVRRTVVIGVTLAANPDIRRDIVLDDHQSAIRGCGEVVWVVETRHAAALHRDVQAWPDIVGDHQGIEVDREDAPARPDRVYEITEDGIAWLIRDVMGGIQLRGLQATKRAERWQKIVERQTNRGTLPEELLAAEPAENVEAREVIAADADALMDESDDGIEKVAR